MTTNDDSVDESNDRLNPTNLPTTMFGLSKMFAEPTKKQPNTGSKKYPGANQRTPRLDEAKRDAILTDGGEPATAERDDSEDDHSERTMADRLGDFKNIPMFECPLCPDAFESKKGVKVHANSKHDVTLDDDQIDLKTYPCDVRGCDEEFDTPRKLRDHVDDNHIGVVIEKNDDGDGFTFVPVSPSEKDDYPSVLPPTHPGEDIADSRFAHLKHTWRIVTNKDDPLGIDWNYIHMREGLRHTRSPIKRGLLTGGLLLNYYADLNREVISRIWTTGKSLTSSTAKTVAGGIKLGILMSAMDFLTTPIRMGLRRAGITRFWMKRLPIAININRAGWGIAATGALSTTSIGVTIGSTLSAASGLLFGGGLLAYYSHEGFRETVRDAGCAVKSAAKTVKNKVKDAWSRFKGWLFSSTKNEKTAATAAA